MQWVSPPNGIFAGSCIYTQILFDLFFKKKWQQRQITDLVSALKSEYFFTKIHPWRMIFKNKMVIEILSILLWLCFHSKSLRLNWFHFWYFIFIFHFFAPVFSDLQQMVNIFNHSYSFIWYKSLHSHEITCKLAAVVMWEPQPLSPADLKNIWVFKVFLSNDWKN